MSEKHKISVFADGVPSSAPPRYDQPGSVTANEMSPPEPPPTGVVASAIRAASRVRSLEGLRGYSTRTAVWIRWAVFALVIVMCSAIAHWAFSTNDQWAFAGVMMLFSVTFMALVGAVGSVLYAESRSKIVEDFQQFAMGIAALPGAALAILNRILAASVAPTAGDEQFLQTLTTSGLAFVYFSTVVIPAAVFAKAVFGGIRAGQKNAASDEELVTAYTRQDGRQA